MSYLMLSDCNDSYWGFICHHQVFHAPESPARALIFIVQESNSRMNLTYIANETGQELCYRLLKYWGGNDPLS